MSPEQQAAFEATMATAGSKATYTGASTSAVAWMLSSEFGILFGVMLGVGGFIVNLYFKYKQDKREQALHEKKMSDLK
jgi:hypothetical protein